MKSFPLRVLLVSALASAFAPLLRAADVYADVYYYNGRVDNSSYSTGPTAGSILDLWFNDSNASNYAVQTGVLYGSGLVNYHGAGTLALTGANTYTGGTWISNGTLSIGNGGTSGSIVGDILNRTNLVFNRSDASSYTGILSGPGTLLKAGAGTLTLSGANSYSGATTIIDGLINFASLANFGSSTLTLNGGGLQWASGNKVDVSSRLAAFGSSGATFDTNGNNVTLASALTGTGGLTKSGYGTLTLSAENTYSGNTTISGGTLQIGAGSTSGSIAGNVLDNGTLIFDRSDALTYAGVISGSGSLTKFGTGRLTLTGANTYTGGTLNAGGFLQIGAGGTSGSIAGDVVNWATLIFNRSDAVTFPGAISGSGTLIQAGSGTLTLSGANTYSGNTIVTGGLLRISTLGNVGTGTVTLDGGGIQWPASNTLDVSSRLTAFGSSGATLDTNGNNVTLASALSGSGALTKSGTGTLTLSAADGHTGNTTVSAGTLALQNTTLSPAFNLASGAVLEMNVASGSRDSSVGTTTFSGAGTLRKTGAGSIYWGGNSAVFAFSPGGLIDVQAGNFQGGSFGNENWTNNYAGLNVASGASFTGAEANVRVDALTGSGLITSGYGSAGYTNFTFGVGNGSGTFSGVLGNDQYGSVGNYVKAGTGTQTLTGNNTFTGTLTINGGLINFASSANLGTGTITLNGGGLQWATGSTFDISPRLAALGSSGATFDTNGNNITLASALTGTGSLIKSGSGTLTLSGTNTFSGGMAINGGTLKALAGSLSSTTGNILLHNSATLDLGGATHTVNALGTASDGLVGTLTNGTISATNGNIYYKSGTSSVTLQGSGHLSIGGDSAAIVTLDGTNNMVSPDSSVQVAITAGTVRLGNPNALAAANSSVAVYGGSLDLNGQLNVRAADIDLGYGSLVNNNTANAASFTGNVTARGNEIGGAGALTLSGTFGSTLSRYGFNKVGDGTLTLTGNNGIRGDVTLSAGTLALGSNTALGDPAFSIYYNNYIFFKDTGTLQYLSGVTTDYSARFSPGNSFAAYNIDVVDGNSVTFASPLSGLGLPEWGCQLYKSGGGTLTLTAVNSDLTATGIGDEVGTYITGGTLALRGGDNRLPASAGVAISGGTLDLGTFNQTLSYLNIQSGSVLGTGTITVNGRTVVANNSTITANLAGSTPSFVFANSTLTGTNTYTGPALILGTTQIGNGGTTGTLGTGSVSIDFGGNLAFNRSDALTVANAIDGGGAVTQSGTGTLTLSGTNTFGGGLTISAGTVSVASDSNLGYSTGPLTFNGGTLQPSASFTSARPITLNSGGGTIDTNGSNLTLSGIISGSGAFTKSGAGTLTFSGANTYTGATTINTGTLKLGGSERLSNSARLTIASLATFDVNGQTETVGSMAGAGAVTLGSGSLDAGGDNTTTTYSGVMSGLGGSLTKSGAGTMTLSGASTYTGTTTISGGTLLLGAADRLWASSSLTLAGGTFATGGFGQTLGTLKLNSSSTIDFGSGASALVFGNSSSVAWSGTLSILNYTSSTDTLRFGTSSGGLTTAQLNQISFGGGLFAQIDANGFVSPASAIPEPSTFAALAGAGALGLAFWRRRKKAPGH